MYFVPAIHKVKGLYFIFHFSVPVSQNTGGVYNNR